MFKKFRYNLEHSPVGEIWCITFVMILCLFFVHVLPDSAIISKSELVITLLSMIAVFDFAMATKILIMGEIKQVNVTYVCPTARKYMSEQEIAEIEKGE